MTAPTIRQSNVAAGYAALATPVVVGNYIVVFANASGTTVAGPITDNLGNTYTLKSSSIDSINGTAWAAYVAPVTVAGTASSIGTGTFSQIMMAYEVTGTSGLEANTAIGQTANAITGAGSANSTVTAVSGAGSLLLSGCMDFNNLAITVGSSATIQNTYTAGGSYLGVASKAVTAGSQTITWNTPATDSLSLITLSFAGIPPALGASSYVQIGAGASSGGPAAVTTQASGSTFLVVCVSGAMTGVTDNKGNTYTLLAQNALNTGLLSTTNVYAATGAGGAGHAITASFTTAGTRGIAFIEITNAGAVDVNITNTDLATPYTITSPTLASASEYALVVIASDSGSATTTFAESTGFTLIATDPDGVNDFSMATFGKSLSSNAAITPSITTSSGASGALTLLTFQSAGAATVPQIENSTTSFSSQRMRHMGTILATGSLLLGTLAPQSIPLPLSADKSDVLVLQQHHPRSLHQQNQDTSKGMAKALFADTSVQVKDFPFHQTQHPSRRLSTNMDTAHGSPTALLFPVAAALPVGKSTPQSAPLRYWFQPSDTSQQAWAGTIPAAVVLPPFVVAPAIQVDRVKNVTDTSQQAWALSIPAAAAQAPFTTYLQNAPERVRYLSDTSQSSWALSIPAATAPFSAVPWAAPDRAHYLTPDTSQQAWALSIPTTQTPFSNLLTTAPERVRYLSDTSQSSPKVTYSDVQAPTGRAADSGSTAGVAAQQTLLNDNTSQSTPLGLFPAPAPFVPAPAIQVDCVKNVTDTSQQAWALSIPSAQAPFNTAASSQTERPRYLADTSQSAYAALNQPAAPFVANPASAVERPRHNGDTSQPAYATINQPAPFVAAPLNATERPRQNGDTSQGAYAALNQAVAPFFVAPVTAVERPRQAVDTSQSAYATLNQPTAPFGASPITAVERPRYQADTSQSMPAALQGVVPFNYSGSELNGEALNVWPLNGAGAFPVYNYLAAAFSTNVSFSSAPVDTISLDNGAPSAIFTFSATLQGFPQLAFSASANFTFSAALADTIPLAVSTFEVVTFSSAIDNSQKQLQFTAAVNTTFTTALTDTIPLGVATVGGTTFTTSLADTVPLAFASSANTTFSTQLQQLVNMAFSAGATTNFSSALLVYRALSFTATVNTSFTSALADTIPLALTMAQNVNFSATLRPGWLPIDDTQNALWQAIPNTQNPAWTVASTTQSAGWVSAQVIPSANWTPIIDTQTVNWQNVNT